MCCWRFKKFKKKKSSNEKKIVRVEVQTSSAPSEIKPEEIKEFTATAGTNPTHRIIDSRSPELKKKNFFPSTDSKNPTTEKSKYVEIMGELHKRIKNKELATQAELTKMSAGDRKKRLADAQRALGFTPNTSIMDRLVKKDREKMERTQNSQMLSRLEATSSKMGDITFGLPQPKKKTLTQDDDTQFTRIGGKKATETKGKDQQQGLVLPADTYFQPPGLEKAQETDELLSEDEDEPVDENNWMFHTKEMQATQDILRIADGDINKFAVGGIDDNTRRGIVFDPYAPLVDLELDEEKQKLFTCTALRYGTFVTTAQMAPTDKEKEEAAKRKRADASAVSVIKIGADISQFVLDYSSGVEALSDCDQENVQPPTEDALNHTQESAKKKVSQDLQNSSKHVTSRKKSRRESKEQLMMSREKTGLPAVSVKNSKDLKNGSKEKQKKSKEAKKLFQELKSRARSRELNPEGPNKNRGTTSREAKKTCKSME